METGKQEISEPPVCRFRNFRLPLLDLSFRELGRTTGTPKTGFLSFDTAGVSSQKVGVAEQRFELCVEILQRAGDTKLAGVGLTGLATTVNANYYVNIFTLLGLQQGGQNGILVLGEREKIVERSLVDCNRSVTGPDSDSGDRRFSATGTQRIFDSLAKGNRSF